MRQAAQSRPPCRAPHAPTAAARGGRGPPRRCRPSRRQARRWRAPTAAGTERGRSRLTPSRLQASRASGASSRSCVPAPGPARAPRSRTCSTARWPPPAAAATVRSSHGAPAARAHWSTARWPLAAADAHVKGPHGAPRPRAHWIGGCAEGRARLRRQRCRPPPGRPPWGSAQRPCTAGFRAPSRLPARSPACAAGAARTCSTPRWPLRAASAQASSSHGAPLSCAHCEEGEGAG
jgi:hypothetical protein